MLSYSSFWKRIVNWSKSNVSYLYKVVISSFKNTKTLTHTHTRLLHAPYAGNKGVYTSKELWKRLKRCRCRSWYFAHKSFLKGLFWNINPCKADSLKGSTKTFLFKECMRYNHRMFFIFFLCVKPLAVWRRTGALATLIGPARKQPIRAPPCTLCPLPDAQWPIRAPPYTHSDAQCCSWHPSIVSCVWCPAPVFSAKFPAPSVKFSVHNANVQF